MSSTTAHQSNSTAGPSGPLFFLDPRPPVLDSRGLGANDTALTLVPVPGSLRVLAKGRYGGQLVPHVHQVFD